MALGEKGKGEASTFKPPAQAEEGFDSVRDELRAQKKIKIMIPSTESRKGDVPVSVNGYAFVIKRDVVVEVPEAVVEVLKNAIITTYRQEKRKDGQEGEELIASNSLRDAFQILQ